MEFKHTNNLIHSSSPYLLQHAHNPVDWQPWSDEIVERAKEEDKLILVSIGYSACHWCHVMEHESFEDEQVAKHMNENFICVKVDREERPDVDHYYMTAVQLMQQRGGWPLNVIALPDGRPIWGGTYFPKDTWVKNTGMVANFYRENKVKAEEYAASLQEGIEQTSLTAEIENVVPVNERLLKNAVAKWKQVFDMNEGGRTGAPKFPMPVNLDFLLYYGFIKKDNSVLDFVETTLTKMARGGIYDQIGGGFARYSVDDKWKIPHFEKMLYDNGQLLSLYSKGFLQFKNEEFKTVVYETVAFIERELLDDSGAFYSALDADSEGEEGKFYVWKMEELKKVITTDFELFSSYFNINSLGFWEHGNYILLRNESNIKFAEKHNISLENLLEKVSGWQEIILEERAKRVRPGLDDKTLISWNAIVIQGLVDAAAVFNDEHFLNLALNNANFIKENIIESDGKLFHNWKNGKKSIDGFLEDYALTIQAFISLYENTGDEQWIDLAGKLLDYSFTHFYEEKSGLFYFSEKNNVTAITNHFQKEDNVIPAANSVMINNLHKMFLILGRPEYLQTAKKMLQHVTPHFTNYPMAYANWGTLMLKLTEPYYEIAIVGEKSKAFFKEMNRGYNPNILWAFSENESEIPLVNGRSVKGKTMIYVCQEGACQLPVESSIEAFNLIKSIK